MAALETRSEPSHESALATLFATVRANLPGASWLQPLRAEAMARIQRDGLPHRRVEAWKYTDFRNKLSPNLLLATREAAAAAPDIFHTLNAHRISFAGGRLVQAPEPSTLSDGLEVISLGEALAMPSIWLRQWLQPGDNPIENLNLAFAADGALVRVGKGVQVTTPIILRASVGQAAMAHTRNVISLEENAELTLIEIDDGASSEQSLATAVTAINLEPGARLRHLRVTASEAASLVVRADTIEIARDAEYRGIILSSGAALARQQSTARLTGTGAAYSLACAYAAGQDQHTDFALEVVHEAPHTTSRILAKGVASGNGHGVVQGRAVVKAAAQKTDSHQLSRALLLSPHAEIDQKPELEIFADDVKCGHGAAVGALDPNQLFYLRARGIPESDARKLLIGAFLGEVTERLPEPYLAPVEAWLAGRMASLGAVA
ncbi:MAG: Fe-S cluster assembly protein SufD [Alphaproteobacteria bacterium]|nr:Fe-S cluster assembly protein SufD [Alphaproteobacteria bacterium]